MRKKKIKTVGQYLSNIKIKVNQGLHHVHALLAKFGKSKNSAMLVICALPENEEDKDSDFIIAYAGEVETLAKVIHKKAKKDKEFKELINDVFNRIEYFSKDEEE